MRPGEGLYKWPGAPSSRTRPGVADGSGQVRSAYERELGTACLSLSNHCGERLCGNNSLSFL